jgi:hypothetical protein
MKRAALVFCLASLPSLAGCSTDSANSLSRDYRNLNNEAIDALMMVTSEERAQLAKTKILGKVYTERLQAIDKRMDSWLQNTDDKLIVLETMTSESVVTLLAELPINAKRLELEQKRLGNLLAAKIKEGVDPKACPALNDLGSTGASLSTLKNQFGTNKFAGLIFAFNDKNVKKWQNERPPNFDDMMKDWNERKDALKLAQ